MLRLGGKDGCCLAKQVPILVLSFFLCCEVIKKIAAKMEAVYKADPLFTNFKPTTAAEAVDRFTRCRRKGLSAMMIPECLIRCAHSLSQEECAKFERWIVNPTGALEDVPLVETTHIREANDEVFQELEARIENKIADAINTTILSEQQQDEKQEDDEKECEVVVESDISMPPLIRQASGEYPVSR